MEAENLQGLSKVLYYIDEYKKGNPDYNASVMKIIAKEIKSHLISNKIKIVQYKWNISYIKLRIALKSYDTLTDAEFTDLSNSYLLDLYAYDEYIDFLKGKLNECIKSKDYSCLDDLCVLAIKLEDVPIIFELYSDDIAKVFLENVSTFTAYYPRNDYSESETVKNEIKDIISKIKKDPQ